jgi:hypothetical protein
MHKVFTVPTLCIMSICTVNGNEGQQRYETENAKSGEDTRQLKWRMAFGVNMRDCIRPSLPR